ncbi:hypothetical protein E4U17_003748 [Claviceps sp. LM77 group G4]|nr:hypothetical protein E4U17_003748 [Claviceps sp. LM77 group G4]KAG6069854.1 hypothetical protein E4U33_004537 [Claviceps sp. LM78 group G4]KAG6073181.1 hypothetical protein E4U16_004851 [Claviceps sp. LM84 group G4]
MAIASRWLRGLATILPSEATASTSSKDAIVIAIANAKPPSELLKVQAIHVIIIKPALMGRPHLFLVPRSAKSVP